MKNQLSTVTEVVVRSAFYIITNYVFVSMGLSFHTHWIAILFLLSIVGSQPLNSTKIQRDFCSF